MSGGSNEGRPFCSTGSRGKIVLQGSDPIALSRAPQLNSIVALAAAILVVLTCVHGHSRRGNQVEQPSAREAAYSREVTAAEAGRCTLYHARFGGQRAQLIKVMSGSVPTFVVMEVGRRDPAMRSLRSAWLKGTYGDAEHVWLGEYSSAEAALASTARLCPPASRCWAGEPDCGAQTQFQTPAQIFFRP